MNASVSNRPRALCRLVQGWVSVFGDGTTVPPRGFGARHVAACECCRQFFAGSAVLESTLRREAVLENEAAPSELERRIIEAVHRTARPQPVRRRAPLAVLSLAGAAAGVALAFLIFQKSGVSVTGPVRPADRDVASGNQLTAATVGKAWSELRPAAGAILNGEPLQREADAVYSDARSAIGFLALNFLPAVPAALDPEAGQISRRSRATNG